ncbi:hypothetical protein LTR36_007483 [Oleoguttula mirabilis]|uniref:F-box domain-containing protein n=1 Tax=Oleoguttula mirabilis TaxID=1507867 RepID=A0AAV9JTR2_9PEZI|nr:hypothetical protein LTR36_007483 [Oleoguttula mirabilis]
MRKAVDSGVGYAVDARGKRTLSDAAVSPVEPVNTARWGVDPIGIPSWSDDETEYVYESSDGGEPLEYTSDEEMLDAAGESEQEDEAEAESEREDGEGYHDFWHRVLVEDKEARKVLERDNGSCPAWHGFLPPGSEPPAATSDDASKPKDEMFPLFYPTEDDAASEHGSAASYTPCREIGTDDDSHDRLMHFHLGKLGYHAKDEHNVEHVAGPGCVANSGYNGHNISAEEMRGCLISQCLVRKPPHGATLRYRPDTDDEAFERDGSFFLSGLSDHMPSRDYDFPTVYPPRHGCDQPHAENYLYAEEQAEEYAMPFHPACLEVYKRASRLDIAGLTDWWTTEGDHDAFHALEREVRDPSVNKCAAQEWRHVGGTEYLAANPLFVPALPALLEQAVSRNPSFNARHDAFEIPEGQPFDPNDAFASLPPELRMLILADLPSKDIASLRLASRSFRQLPLTFFHDLLLREMPWLWEVWDATPYAHWACTTAAELERSDKTYANASQAVQDYIRIVKEELPELTDQMNEAGAAYQASLDLDAHHFRASAAARPLTLPRDRTNWYTLYTLLTRHMRRGELKGLQNRARIWRDCDEILRRIHEYRAQGAFPVQDRI